MDKALFFEQVTQEAANSLLSISILNQLKTIKTVHLHYLFSQLYYFVDHFPGFLGTILWKTNDKNIRFAIIDNLVDECGGIEKIHSNDYTATHSGLLKNFITSLNNPETHLVEKSIATKILINDFNNFFINSTPIEVMAAMASMESISTQWFGLIYQQLLERNEFSQGSLYFFELHTRLDEVHGDILKAALMPLLTDAESFALLRNGAMTSVAIWKKFYESITQEMEANKK